jgi:membrane-bound metal-dependent hydrolase YbcI (DUF457 family)
MILGHYAVAFAAKRVAPRTSLGTLVLAAQLLDGLWPIFLLVGLERVRVAPGAMAANSLEFVHYPYTHSLAAAVAWGVLLGGAYYAARRYPAGAWVVAIAVVSHWLLDVPMHGPDLPLWPGSAVRVGLGLWNSVPATLIVEFGLFAAGIAAYLRATRARDRVGRWAFWSMVAVLAAVLMSGILGPPPTSERGVAVGALGLWLFVPWGYWFDRHRGNH